MSDVLKIKAVRAEEFPRTFTKRVKSFSHYPEIEPCYKALEKNIKEVSQPKDLEQWLLDYSELDAALNEEHSRLYIAMTCNTANEAASKAYLTFIEEIEPQLKQWNDKLIKAFLAADHLKNLDQRRTEVLVKKMKNKVKLFREENIPLQTEDSKLGQEYQKISGGMTVQWEGEEKTLKQMASLMEETDRAKREAVWTLVDACRKKHASQLDEIFSKLVKNRHQRAINAGFKNFRDYQHASYNRFDYTPDDCFTFHHTVEHLVVPLLEKLRSERAKKLSLPVLRPWDLAVDADGEQPLRPFTKATELIDACQNIFSSLDDDLAAQFKKMNELDLLDLENRKGKAPGGYQSTLDEVRLPFIFMNASGTNQDLFTLLHEAGHAFHAFASREEPWVAYRHAPMEFCEVASMSMELMGMDYLQNVYRNPHETKRAKRDILEDILVKLPWIAAIDAFQHWIYLNPEHTAEERAQQFCQLMKRFNPGIDCLNTKNRLVGNGKNNFTFLKFLFTTSNMVSPNLGHCSFG